MRKFKLLASDYSNIKAGEIYHESMPIDDLMRTVFDYFIMHPEDWQEVFDEPKTLHKDTDLGYFAIEIMKSIIKIAPLQKPNPEATNELFCKDCISLAKELIKQLNEETR